MLGPVAPDTIQTIACQNAVGTVKAYGFDPCDPNYAEAFELLARAYARKNNIALAEIDLENYASAIGLLLRSNALRPNNYETSARK